MDGKRDLLGGIVGIPEGRFPVGIVAPLDREALPPKWKPLVGGKGLAESDSK